MAAADDTAADGFLSRWSRRKVALRQGQPLPAAPLLAVPAAAPLGQPVSTPNTSSTSALTNTLASTLTNAPGPTAALEAGPPVAADTLAAQRAAVLPAPTLDDVAALAPGADVRRFVAPGVDRGVKNAALKKLFADPHFNVMDGLDTYIDDYGLPDPLPAGMLRQMAQSAFLGLFSDEPKPADAADSADAAGANAAPPSAAVPAQEPVPEPGPTLYENADLRLQPHDAAGCGQPAPGAEPHARG